MKTEEHVTPEFFGCGDLGFFKHVLEGESNEEGADTLIYGDSWFQIAEHDFTTEQVHLPDFVDWIYDDIFRTISSELDWTAHSSDAEHSDCRVDGLVPSQVV